MKLTIADLVKAGVLQGVEKKRYCGECPLLHPKESEQSDNKEPHSCAYMPQATLHHLGHHPELPVLEDCPFNKLIDTLYSQELDLGKLFDVEKVKEIISINSDGCGQVDTDILAQAICDKANELVKDNGGEG